MDLSLPPSPAAEHLPLLSQEAHFSPLSPSPASARPPHPPGQVWAVVTAQLAQGALHGTSTAVRCPAACSLLNHHRTRPVCLFTAIFICSNEACSSSGTSEGKGGMARAGRGRIPGTCPRLPLPAPAAPSLPPASARALPTCEVRHFLPLPGTHLGWKMSKPRPARSCCMPPWHWRPVKSCVPLAPCLSLQDLIRTAHVPLANCTVRALPVGCQSPWGRESCSPWL